MSVLVETILSKLKWPVREKQGTSGILEMTSCPESQEHVILWPVSGLVPEIRMAHELLHAFLCEQVHPQFGRILFCRGTQQTFIQSVRWACREAQDWFVDDILHEMAPDAVEAEIKEYYELKYVVPRLPSEYELEAERVAGLVTAQAVKYLGMKVRTYGRLTDLVEAYLSTPPEHPSLQALVGLINKILMVHNHFRAKLVSKDGWEALKVEKVR